MGVRFWGAKPTGKLEAGTLREREREPRLIHVISIFMSTNKFVQVIGPHLVFFPAEPVFDLNMHREQLKTETDRVSERTEFLR